MDDATLTYSDAAAIMDDRLILVLLLLLMMMMIVMMVVVLHSLLRKECSLNDDARDLKDMVTEFSRRGRDQSVVSKELLELTQRLLDVELCLLDGGEKSSSAASDQQLMDNAAAAKKKAAAAVKRKKKRNKRNKAAAKHKGTKRRSWLGVGIISLIMVMAAASGSIITTLITLSKIHQSDGSSEGKAPPTLPPTASTSLRRRDLQLSDNMASTSPASVSPFAAVVQAPVFSPTPSSSPATPSSPTMAANPTEMCFDTPNWKDIFGDGCEGYEENDEPGCPEYGSLFDGGMGVANDNCCYCGGGILSVSQIHDLVWN
jgi:flagellar basal body-associated protein FliL